MMKITRITPPKFKVGRFVLNEYELRQFLLEVAKMERPSGIIVKEITNGTTTTAEIDSNGGLSNNLPGLATATNIQFNQLKEVQAQNKRSFSL